MPKFKLHETTSESTEFSIIPEESMLDARVEKVDVQVKPYKDDDGNPVEKVVFQFVVTDGEFKKRKLWGETSTKFTNHPDCKLRAWMQEIMGGQDIDAVGTEVDTDDLIDQECRVTVGVREWTDKNTGELKRRNTVQDVLRARSGAPVADWDSPF